MKYIYDSTLNLFVYQVRPAYSESSHLSSSFVLIFPIFTNVYMPQTILWLGEPGLVSVLIIFNNETIVVPSNDPEHSHTANLQTLPPIGPWNRSCLYAL